MEPQDSTEICEENDCGSEQPPMRQRVLEVLGALFTMVWIVILIGGWDRKWFANFRMIELILLLLVLVFAKPFVSNHFAVIIRQLFDSLQKRSVHSNLAFICQVCIWTMIGAAVGWALTIRHTTEIIAACSAAFGALLLGLMAFLITKQHRQTRSDHQQIDEEKGKW